MALRTYLASTVQSIFLVLPILSGCAQVVGIEDWTPQPERPPGCNANPWACPAGQTCWVNAAGDWFECFNAGVGQGGAVCQNYAGSPTCGEYLGCLHLETQANGTCTPYCDLQDPAHGCPMGTSCQGFLFPLPTGDVDLYLCAPP